LTLLSALVVEAQPLAERPQWHLLVLSMLLSAAVEGAEALRLEGLACMAVVVAAVEMQTKAAVAALHFVLPNYFGQLWKMLQQRVAFQSEPPTFQIQPPFLAHSACLVAHL